jgi:hypothetical protein
MFKAATFAISVFLVGMLLGCSSDATKGGEPLRAPPEMADPAPKPTQIG